jgi:hypothetical protein
MIHHVRIACPRGSEETLRAFCTGLLGLAEKPKPPLLAGRGGCWFAGAGIELHLGVDDDFVPAGKAHPGLLWPDLDGLAATLTAHGYPVRWAPDEELPGYRRFHTSDPYGNRIEFLAPH